MEQPNKRAGFRPGWLFLVIVVLVCDVVIGAAANSVLNHESVVSTIKTLVSIPTPTPLAIPFTIVQAMQGRLVRDASVLTGKNVHVHYSDSGNVPQAPALIVEEGSGSLRFIQNECFTIQSTVWQDPLLAQLGYLDFAVVVFDGNRIQRTVGECVLLAAKGEHIAWNALDAPSAWNNGSYSRAYPLS